MSKAVPSWRRATSALSIGGGAFLPRPPDVWVAATTIIFQAHPFAALPQHFPLAAVLGGIPSSPRSSPASELDIDFRAVLGRGVPLVCLANCRPPLFRSAHPGTYRARWRRRCYPFGAACRRR